MAVNNAKAEWQGSFKEGKGHLSVASGAFSGDYSYHSRMEGPSKNTNPEELIGAAHAGCFTMALSAKLGQKGFTPEKLETEAKVTLDTTALKITTIELILQASIPKIEEAQFQEIVKDAKENCPVSKALAGVDISVKATLA